MAKLGSQFSKIIRHNNKLFSGENEDSVMIVDSGSDGEDEEDEGGEEEEDDDDDDDQDPDPYLRDMSRNGVSSISQSRYKVTLHLLRGMFVHTLGCS